MTCECQTAHTLFPIVNSSEAKENCEPYDLVRIITCGQCGRRWLRVVYEQPLVTQGTHIYDALLPEDFPSDQIPTQQAEIENYFLHAETCFLGGALYKNSPQPFYKYVGIPKRKV